MTREQAIEAIKVMQAWVAGKEVESKLRGKIEWMPNDSPQWDWAWNNYRIKPTYRPWTADEVPLGAWMRFKCNPQDRVLLNWVSVQVARDLWLDEREHSTDGGVTWKPCGVEEVK